MFSVQIEQANSSERNAETISILKTLALEPIGMAEDASRDCWLRQLFLIETFIREVPKHLADMVDCLRNSSVCDRKCAKTWRKEVIRRFTCKVHELKEKINDTIARVAAISNGIDSEVVEKTIKFEVDAMEISTVEMQVSPLNNTMKRDDDNQVSSYEQVMLVENSANNDDNTSSNSEEPFAKSIEPTASARFTCPDCSATTITSLRAYHRHCRQVHGHEKTHKCDRCPMAFRQSYELQKHMRTPHTRDVKRQSYLCDLCPKICADKSVFKIHRRTHTGESRFICDICSRTLGTKNSLIVHMRTHTNERPFKCPQCCKTFRQEAVFRRHQYRHTDHRPHKCNLCIKAFLTKGQLAVHVLSHTGERPHVCPLCKRGYTKRFACKTHIRTAHKEVDVEVVFPRQTLRINKIGDD